MCRPLIICDRGVPRVKQEHIAMVKKGEIDVLKCKLAVYFKRIMSGEARGGMVV